MSKPAEPVWSTTVRGSDGREYVFRVYSDRPTRLSFDGPQPPEEICAEAIANFTSEVEVEAD